MKLLVIFIYTQVITEVWPSSTVTLSQLQRQKKKQQQKKKSLKKTNKKQLHKAFNILYLGCLYQLSKVCQRYLCFFKGGTVLTRNPSLRGHKYVCWRLWQYVQYWFRYSSWTKVLDWLTERWITQSDSLYPLVPFLMGQKGKSEERMMRNRQITCNI